MTVFPGRVSRKFQNVQADLRGILNPRTIRRQTEYRTRRPMTCADSVRTVQQTQDWTEGVGMSPSGRFQVIEDGRKPKLITREGIRWEAGRGALIAVGVILCLVLVLDLMSIGVKNRQNDKLSLKTQALEEKIADLEWELNYSAGDVNVMTEAVRLNLISGYGARTITLTAPPASLTLTDSITPETTPEGRMISYAGD